MPIEEKKFTQVFNIEIDDEEKTLKKTADEEITCKMS